MLRGQINSELVQILLGITRLSLNKVSSRAKFSASSYIYELVAGQRNPTLETVDRLANVFWVECQRLGYIDKDLKPGPLLQAIGVHTPADLWLKLLKVEIVVGE